MTTIHHVNRQSVSAAKAGAVRAAATGLGFVPHRDARRLRTRQSEIVAMLIPDVERAQVDVDTVVADSLGGGRQATEDLLNLGFRRIGCLSATLTTDDETFTTTFPPMDEENQR